MRNLITYVLLFTVMISCEELEEITENSSSSELQGTWELQSATGCFCFFPDDFDYASNKLTFNETADEVIVENSENSFLVVKEGTYPISVVNNSITIDVKEYTYIIEDTSLTLTFVDDPELSDDEITLIFTKL